ncbi:MAG: hypothetical protein ACLFU8_07045 [Anaerolineales bacterium]
MKRYLDALRAAYPDLAITTAELNLRGQNNDVRVVNGELIFRFPRYPEAIEHLQTESAILQAVGQGVPLPVPSPTFVHLEAAQPGDAFEAGMAQYR